MIETPASEVCLSSADQRLLALFDAAQRWIYEQDLVLVEIESILGQAGKLLDLYQGRLTAEKLPPSLRTPYELMAWTRPVRAKDDVTGMEQYAHWFARWLVVCLPGNEDLQNAVSCCDLDPGSIASSEVRILMATCLRLLTSAGGPTWTCLSWR